MSQELLKQEVMIKNKYGLEGWQVSFLMYLMLPKALRPSRAKIIARLGITEPTYYYWHRHPQMAKARRDLVKLYYQDDIPDILMTLKNEAIAGNERAARLFLEYVDDFKREIDEDDAPIKLPKAEVNIIINNLYNKFYGGSNTNSAIEGETGS